MTLVIENRFPGQSAPEEMNALFARYMQALWLEERDMDFATTAVAQGIVKAFGN